MGTLILTALGILAVVADNPLTLVLIWAAIDISELIAQMRVVEDPGLSERTVIAFASRAAGIFVLFWADMVSVSQWTGTGFPVRTPAGWLISGPGGWSAHRCFAAPSSLFWRVVSAARFWNSPADDLRRIQPDLAGENSSHQPDLAGYALLVDPGVAGCSLRWLAMAARTRMN